MGTKLLSIHRPLDESCWLYGIVKSSSLKKPYQTEQPQLEFELLALKCYKCFVDKKRLVLDFIKKHKIGVIATVGADNKPEAAVIEFGETDDLELIFDAFENSRKIQNVKQNSRVAFVIGWDEDITIQYEGEAFELTGDELEKYQRIYLAKNPAVAKWIQTEGITFFKVIPKWIRYSDLNKDPWEIFEVKF